MKRFLLAVGLGLALLAATASAPSQAAGGCAGWVKLAHRIKAPVYCPGWLPDPLTNAIKGKWNNIDAADPDRSYLESFVWQETGGGAAGGELHVNLRGYPGRTRLPNCIDVNTVNGKTRRTPIPCFADPHGVVTAGPIHATMYTVNQDADQWHVLLAWRYRGGLYTLSEHVAPPLDYTRVVANLKRMLRALVLIQPR